MAQHAAEPENIIDGPFCNRTVDSWGGCWPDTPAGEQAKIHCPDIPSFNPKAFAYGDCTINGTWNTNNSKGGRWANYSECGLSTQFTGDRKHIYIFIGGFSLSLILLLISLGIFFRFSHVTRAIQCFLADEDYVIQSTYSRKETQLRCDRITIHKHLLLSYVLTGVSWILYYVFAVLDGEVLVYNTVWCQTLHVFCQYFTLCNFLWMFCEGLYLNTVMVFAFNSGKILIRSCYVIGWGIPVLLAIVYASIRRTDPSSVDCWVNESDLQWIMYGPIVFSIGVNVIFLINIVRLLVTKLRQMPEADQTRKATRATFILVPLLGLQYLLLPMRPASGSNLEDAYHILIALLVSLQGAFVSMMYCFFNSEVIQVLRRKWNQHRLMSAGNMRNSAIQGTTYTTAEPTTLANTTYYSAMDPQFEMTKLTQEHV